MENLKLPNIVLLKKYNMLSHYHAWTQLVDANDMLMMGLNLLSPRNE